MSQQEPPLEIGYPIQYSDAVVTLDTTKSGNNEYSFAKLKKAMTTKAKCWSYEGEVRSFIPKPLCISRETGGTELDFVKFNLKGVIRIDFGIRFPPDEIPQIIQTYRSNLSESVMFYRATCSYDEYKIEDHEI